MSLLGVIASRHRAVAGITILGQFFDDFGNSIAPGTGARTFSITPPVGTTAILVINTAVNRKVSGITINGVAATLIADQAQNTAGGNGAIYALTSAIPTTAVNLVVSWLTGTSAATHTEVWFLKGGSLTTANWTSSVVNSGTTNVTTQSSTVTPTAANGMIFAHVACRMPGTAGTLTPTGYTENGQDATIIGSVATSSLMSSWGSTTNSSTAVKTVSFTTAGAVRNVLCMVHIPNL